MDFSIQLFQIIERIHEEKMWNTLQEHELLCFMHQQQKIYCSFLGKNTPYYGIEFFFKEEGEQALLRRFFKMYLPEYIAR